MKYLLVLAVVLLIWWLFRLPGSGRSHPRRGAEPGKAGAGAPARMVACHHCGVHLPEAEALNDAQGRPYCSEPHRLAGPR